MQKRIDDKCKCKSSTGSTHVECCNICGLPLQKETWHFILSDHDISRVGAEVINFLAEEKTEYEILKERWGSAIKYLDIDCPHCGKHRVELFANNKGVCEKCSYNALTGEFESEHWTLYN